MTAIVDMQIEKIGRKIKTLTGDDVNGYSVTCECGNAYTCESYKKVPCCPSCETEEKKASDPAEINKKEISSTIKELEELKASGCTDASKYLEKSNYILDLCYKV